VRILRKSHWVSEIKEREPAKKITPLTDWPIPEKSGWGGRDRKSPPGGGILGGKKKRPKRYELR